MRKYVAGALILAGLCLVASGFSASATAANPETVTYTFNLKPKLDLTITGSAVAFNDVYPDFVYTAGPINVAVKSNTGWKLTYPAGLKFTSGVKEIPITVLAWQLGDAGGFTSYTNALTTLWSGGKPGASTHFDFQLNVPYDYDPADTYTATIEYTLSTSP